MQFYIGNFINENGKGGSVYTKRAGFCMGDTVLSQCLQ